MAGWKPNGAPSPRQAKRHPGAVAKPLTTIAHHTHKALTTIASKASQKPLTSINGQLAAINVKKPREAQNQRKRKYPQKKTQQAQAKIHEQEIE